MCDTNYCSLKWQKWIGNQNSKRKLGNNTTSIDESAVLKKAKCLRGPSGYNLFCSGFFKSGTDMHEFLPNLKEFYELIDRKKLVYAQLV